MTPGDILDARRFDVFCERGVMAAIHELADFSHSKTMADLVTEGKFKPELLITLGKVAPPRYASFVGRAKDDPDPSVRHAVATALGLIDNEGVAVPVLVQLLTRGRTDEDLPVRLEAAESLVKVAKRKGTDKTRQRVVALLREPDRMTVALAARVLAATGDGRGLEKLRELTSDSGAGVRQEALLALAEYGDRAAREVVTRRLQDESLAVRACAVYALGRIGGPPAVPVLRKAVEEALAYEAEIERRKARGESEGMLRQKYGLGVFDLRETLQQAVETAQRGR